MPTRKKTKAKKSKKTKVKAKKRVIAKTKRARKTKTMKMKAKKGKKKTIAKAKGPSPLGKVVHFYDRISVAIVELSKPLAVGDTVTFKRGVQELRQKITSMQIEHLAVPAAKKGDVVGVQVKKEVQKGALVTSV